MTGSRSHITHINASWTRVFIYSWHFVFHSTLTFHPPPNLQQITNHALLSAYARWDAISPHTALSAVSIVVDGQHLWASRGTHADSPAPLSASELDFEAIFKAKVRRSISIKR